MLWLNRRTRALAVAAFAVLAIAGCGGSSSPPPQSTDLFSGQASSTPSAAPSTATPTTTKATPAPTTTYIGTLTESGPGTKLTESVSVSKLGYGSAGAPPAAVLSGTSVSWPIDTSAFVYAQLTISYSQGTVPADLAFPLTDSVGSAGGQGPQSTYGVMEVDGQWTDGGGSGVSVTVQPGQTVTFPTWIDLNDAITNVSPTLSTSAANDITFTLIPSFDQAGTTVVSGPRAADCNTNYVLLLLAKPPTADCQAGSGNWFGDS